MFLLVTKALLLWIQFSALVVTVQTHPFAFENAALQSTNATQILPRLAGRFRIEDCGDTDIMGALREVFNVLQETVNRLDDLYDQFTGQVDFEDFTLEQMSTYDTFETIYGKLYDNGIMSDTLDRIEYIRNAALKMGGSLSGLNELSLDIYCDSNWLSTTDDGGREDIDEDDNTVDERTRWDDSGNGLGWRDVSTGDTPISLVLCDSSTLNVQGFCINDNQGIVSVVSVCNKPLNSIAAIGTTLTTEAAIVYSAETTSLQSVVKQTVSYILLHELSHAGSVMGYSMDENHNLLDVMIDASYTDSAFTTQNGYGWQNIVGLRNYNDETALRNADSFAFFCAAMFLKQNTWWTGLAKPLSYTAGSAAGIEFD